MSSTITRDGAASAAPDPEFDLAPGLRLEERIDGAEGDAIEARWEFGRWMLTLIPEGGKQVPKGVRNALVAATHKSRQELGFRMQFAKVYGSPDELANAVSKLRSWHAIIQGLSSAAATDDGKRSDDGERPKRQRSQTKRRAQNDRTITGKTSVSQDPKVLRWTRAKIRQGWDRDRIVAASKDNTDGWPLPGKHLTNGGVSEIRTAIAHVERVEDERKAAAKRKDKSPQARMRELKAQRKNGSDDLLELQGLMVDLVHALVPVSRLTDSVAAIEYEKFNDLNDYTAERLTDLYADMVMLGEWWQRVIGPVQARIKDGDVRRKIKVLRDPSGRTEPEYDTSCKIADILESKLQNRLAA